MRYLKYFESNVHPIPKELQEFCDNNLAYLIDTGLQSWNIRILYDNNGCMRHALKINYKGYFLVGILGSNKRWFIPFLTILNSKV
jgi:hypothetical protein